ncbi:MAG TPA: diacylglycerol kinase family protein [Blastocatellia bacterium]|nr:diacylglycerol kinase family protein [Blastocatellia bacterium]
MRRIAVLINTAAGSVRDESLCSLVAEAFILCGVPARVQAVEGAKLREATRVLREEGFNTIVAGGGDGTVSAVACELVGHPVALGVLPLGTLNHFAKDLNLPAELDEAVDLICSGPVSKVDVGTVNGYTFINNSSLGLYPDQVRVRQRWRPRIGKWLAMVVASIVVLVRFRSLWLVADLNGRRVRRRCPMVLISNNMYSFEPASLTRRERLDEGVLGMYLLREEGRAGLIQTALHSLVFNIEDAISFEPYCTTETTIMTDRKRVRVALDGEVLKLTSPLQYRILPGSLWAITPPRQR